MSDDKKVPEGRFFKLRSLDFIEDINSRIYAGETMPEIARWVQEDKKAYLDVGYKSLVTILSKYRNDFLPPLEVSQRAVIAKHGESLERVAKGIQELEEISWLYDVQKSRIKMGISFEKKMGFLNKNLNVDVALALSILRRSHDIKMDLGMNGGRNLGTMNVRPEFMVDLKANYGEDVYAAFQNPESRNKILGAMSAMVNKISGVIDVPQE